MNTEKKTVWRKKAILIYIGLLIYTVIFFAVAGEDVNYKTRAQSAPEAVDNIGEITEKTEIVQEFESEDYKITGLVINTSNYGHEELDGELHIGLYDSKGNRLEEAVKKVSELVNGENTLYFAKGIRNEGKNRYELRISGEGVKKDHSVTLQYGVKTEEESRLYINGEEKENAQLSISMIGKTADAFGPVFRWSVIALCAGIGMYLAYMMQAEKKGKMTFGMHLLNIFHEYRFLLEQLVMRDFKKRYKRSALGIMWSFINPLLVMLVQYFVFSFIFRSNTENYIVYLLSGITFFNYYSECTNNGLLSVTSNAPLITKVYVPKYIYPISTVLTMSINFVISLILLALVCMMTGVMPTRYLLMFPYAVMCIIILNVGATLILASGMVFFRDVQFIYSVFMTLLSYATPLFWNLNMMPEWVRKILMINPLCAIVTFARSCLLSPGYPGSMVALLCLVIPAVILILGGYVFRKTQDSFVLYI